MSSYYICSVSSNLPMNYDIGAGMNRWGVEERHSDKIKGVSPGDYIFFVVAGKFRGLHQVIRGPFYENTRIWPPRNDLFPYRVEIAPAELDSDVAVADLADRISFMRGKHWPGTLQGRTACSTTG